MPDTISIGGWDAVIQPSRTGNYVALVDAEQVPDEWTWRPVPMWRGRCAEGEFEIDIDGVRTIVTLDDDGNVIALRHIVVPEVRGA